MAPAAKRKSLEERIDDITSGLEGLTREVATRNAKLDLLSSQLATLIANENVIQNLLAIAIANLNRGLDQLKSSNAKLDTTMVKLDLMTTVQASSGKSDDTCH